MDLSQVDRSTTTINHLATDWRPTLTLATPIHVARALLRNSGETAAVVFRSGHPVGVVKAAALANAPTNSGLDAPVATVMDYLTVSVAPHADARETVRTFTRAAQDWLLRRPVS